MPQEIMDTVMLERCSHEFSWPRRGADGEYYQVCQLCDAEYKYDWITMQRVERVEHVKHETLIRRPHPREKRPSWTPRAGRVKLNAALRYRSLSAGAWCDGMIRNLSQTGVLFRGPQSLPVNTLIEMIFEMPEEVSGQRNRTVLCQGRIIRFSGTRNQDREQEQNQNQDEADNPDKPGLLAAFIVDYKFVR